MHVLRCALSIFSGIVLLAIAGCAFNPPFGKHVYQLDTKSMADLPESYQSQLRVASVDTVQGTGVTRKGDETTSLSMNYVGGMVKSTPPALPLQTITVQDTPLLQFELFNNGSDCTDFPPASVATVTHAMREVLQSANSPMPPGVVEIHFVPPYVGMHNATTFRQSGPNIHLTYYFKCLTSTKGHRDYYLGTAVVSTSRELTHAAFLWRGRGNGTQSIASGAEMCMLDRLDDLYPPALKALKGVMVLSMHANLNQPESVKFDSKAMCADWTSAMRKLASDQGSSGSAAPTEKR